MILCHVCGHARLLHDSWGCRDRSNSNGPCGCGVSIIYLTPGPRPSPEQEKELLDQAHQVMIDADLRSERKVREMQERALTELQVEEIRLQLD